MNWFSYASPFVMVVAVWVAYRIGKRSRDRREEQQGGGERQGQHRQVVTHLLLQRQGDLRPFQQGPGKEQRGDADHHGQPAEVHGLAD